MAVSSPCAHLASPLDRVLLPPPLLPQVLSQLPQLRSLSLKGCPVAALPGYKEQVLSLVPRLEILDSVRIQERPRKQAASAAAAARGGGVAAADAQPRHEQREGQLHKAGGEAPQPPQQTAVNGQHAQQGQEQRPAKKQAGAAVRPRQEAVPAAPQPDKKQTQAKAAVEEQPREKPAQKKRKKEKQQDGGEGGGKAAVAVAPKPKAAPPPAAAPSESDDDAQDATDLLRRPAKQKQDPKATGERCLWARVR